MTYAVVEEGLKTPKADQYPRDGEVTVREWIDYAAARVPEIHERFIKNASRCLQVTMKKAEKEQKIEWVLQRPRVFYRREAEAEGFVVAKPDM